LPYRALRLLGHVLSIKKVHDWLTRWQAVPGLHPGLTAHAPEAHFKQKQRHRLGPLAQQLAGMLADLKLGRLPPDTSRLLQDPHQLDPTGETFRYDGQLKTSASHVDVPRLVRRFRATFGILHGRVLTALDEHASFLREISAEYGP
jgi:hypothetical protein